MVLTYAEFGRRPRENQSGGTDHGTASVHFALGGRVAGGLYGAAPALDAALGRRQPRSRGRLPPRLCTVLDSWWGVDRAPLGGSYAPLPFLRPDVAVASRRLQ